MPWCHLPYL
uniref:Uncharacterized protein n=1 Tax=Arundo donax TaxID=35708 RepID=A0A0A9DYX7_ARUDO